MDVTTHGGYTGGPTNSSSGGGGGGGVWPGILQGGLYRVHVRGNVQILISKKKV